MENKSHAAAAGAFVLAVSALMVAMFMWIARDQSDRIPVLLRANEAVSGLQPQATVRFRGVEIGMVNAIELDTARPGEVKVHTLIDRHAPITTQSVGTLGYQGVTGLAFIQIDTPKTAANAPLIADAHAAGEAQASAAGKAKRKDNNHAYVELTLNGGLISRLTDQGGDMMKGLQESIERLNKVMSDNNLKNLDRALAQVSDSMAAASKSADAITLLAANTDKLLQTQLDPVKTSIPKLIEDTQAAMKDMRQAANQVGEAASNFNSALSRFDAEGGALDQVGDGAQTFTSNTLPRLNSTLENAERTLRQLSRTAQGLNENPQAILYGTGTIPPGPGEAGFKPPAQTQP